MVDFVEPIEPGWVSLEAASVIKGVSRTTIYRWAAEQGLLSYRQVPTLDHVSGKDSPRILVRRDEVEDIKPRHLGRPGIDSGRIRRPMGLPMTEAEQRRLDATQKAYREHCPGCQTDVIQTTFGAYMLQVWEDHGRKRMIVTVPLSEEYEGDSESIVESMPVDWLSLKEAATIKGVTRQTVYRWATHSALISYCRLPTSDPDAKMVPILVRRSEVERLIPPPRGNPNKTGSRGNRPEGDPLTPNERQRLKEIEETYRKAKPDCVVDLQQYASGYYAAEIFENATRKKMVVTLPLAPGEMVVS